MFCCSCINVSAVPIILFLGIFREFLIIFVLFIACLRVCKCLLCIFIFLLFVQVSISINKNSIFCYLIQWLEIYLFILLNTWSKSLTCNKKVCVCVKCLHFYEFVFIYYSYAALRPFNLFFLLFVRGDVLFFFQHSLQIGYF